MRPLKRIKTYLKASYPCLFSLYRDSRSRAKWWAKKSKRLDLCAAQFAYMMHYTGNPFKDSICLELGSGWVLSHAILAYLLGAEKVYATDYFPLADLTALRLSINSSDAALIRDILAPYEDHEILREKIENIKSISNWSLSRLKSLGITYSAPIDLTIALEFNDGEFAYDFFPLHRELKL